MLILGVTRGRRDAWRDALRDALMHRLSVVEPPYTPTHEIAYCMGLIVGEGCFSGDLEQPCLVVAPHASDPQPLLALRNVFGGILNGPYVYGIRQVRRWVLRGFELEEALPYIERWLPASRKREQFEVWRVKWAAYFEHQRKVIPRDRPRFHARFHDQCFPTNSDPPVT